MLQGLRTASTTLAGRILLSGIMGLIIFAFAIWGIGNIFQGFGQNHLGYVGWSEITISAYRDAYQSEMRRLQAQSRRQITNEEARLAGVDRHVLGQMIANMAMDQEARNLGLAISDKQIAASILEDPSFKGANGQFDRDRFNEVLRQAGFSEKSFVAEQRSVYLRRQIDEAVGEAVTAPRAALETYNRYNAETRAIDYLVLPAKSAGEIKTPADDVLKPYYEDRKQSYHAPEYRSLVVLRVTPATLAKPDLVSDADAMQRYEQVKAQRYETPEKRDLQQIVFRTEADAQTAEERIKGGTSFEEIATERKLAPADIELGIKSKADLLDKATGDAAFALAEDGVSEPVKNSFGYALLRVTKIYPAATKPYAEVARELKTEIATERVRDDVTKLHDKIEDLRSSGKPLTEAAKAVELEPRKIEAVDATGHDKTGAPVPDLPESEALLKAAFASDIGVDNDTIETRDRGYIWYEVAKIEPARVRSYDEVKADVEKAWRRDETAKLLSAKAAELVKKLEGGATLPSIATAEGVEVKSVPAVARTGSAGLPQGAVAQIFNVTVGAAGSAAGSDDGRILFKVTGSTVPPLDTNSEQGKALADRYAAVLANDVVAQFVQKVQADVGYSINPDAMRIAIGSVDTN